ncbi:MAG: hypothetical protein V9G19_01605 [Tetrasphaera sp.]
MLQGSVHIATEGPGPSEPVRAPTPRTAADLIAILDEIPGVGPHLAQVIIAEIGLDHIRQLEALGYEVTLNAIA